jgi:hypothetical protein
LIAELGLTSNQSAASRREAPDTTAFTTRSRNSKEHGLGIDPPSITRINAARFDYASPSGNPDSIQPKLALAAGVKNEELKSILLRLTEEYRQLADRFEVIKNIAGKR